MNGPKPNRGMGSIRQWIQGGGGAGGFDSADSGVGDTPWDCSNILLPGFPEKIKRSYMGS